jgi:hypothetical protein
MHKRDTIFRTICKAGAFVALLLMVGIFAQLLIHSADAWKHFGISFLWGIDWDPAMDIYGASGTVAASGWIFHISAHRHRRLLCPPVLSVSDPVCCRRGVPAPDCSLSVL